jgi:VanZ family protein
MSESDEFCRGPARVTQPGRADASLRSLNIVCLACLLLIVYGSLTPFRFAFSWDEQTQARFHEALHSWEHTTRSKVVINVLLYVPWGVLLATRRRLAGGSPLRAFTEATLAALALTFTMESLQLFIPPERSADLDDVCTNTFGGLLGGLAGAILGPAIYVRSLSNLRHRWTLKPASLAAAVLCLMLAADGLAPLMPIRSRSDLGWNLRHSYMHLGKGLAVHPWHHWAVCRIGVFAALAVLIGAASRNPRRRWLRGAAYAAGFAVALEVAKLAIEDREFNIANVVVGAAGAVVGLLLAMPLSGRLCRRTVMLLAAWLSVLYLLYRQWVPFAFVVDWQAVADKMPSGEFWLPLTDYALVDRSYSDFLHFTRIMVLMAATIYAACQAGGWLVRGGRRLRLAGTLGASAILGLAMELGKFFIPGHTPTTTNMLAFILGGGLGVWTFQISTDVLPDGSQSLGR